MSFKLALDSHYWWPVNNPRPVDGEWVDSKFRAKFVRMEREAYAAFMDEIKNKKMVDSQVVPRVMFDWADVVDPDNQPVQFTPDALARMCRVPGAASNIVKAWMESQAKVVEKN